MIIMLFLALVLFTVYFIHTFHYSRHWMENFEVTLAFSEEQAGEGDTLFLYETNGSADYVCEVFSLPLFAV